MRLASLSLVLTLVAVVTAAAAAVVDDRPFSVVAYLPEWRYEVIFSTCQLTITIFFIKHARL